MAGPAVTRVLADYGATVIRVETPSRPGAGRSMAPFRGGQFAPQNSLFFDNMNAGKLGLALNLSVPEGREVARDLVHWADVVAESFAPRAFRAWGLDYDSLCQIKPDLVMMSSCLFGQDGPLSDVSGFGTMGAAVSTFIDLTGYPDRAPAGPFSAYTDTIAPRFLLAALLAALDHRRRTGQGQYIDHSQVESSIHFISPYLLDWQLNGRALTRMGNRDPDMAPHGIFPSRGDDDWVAIAARDDDDWLRLCAALDRPDLAADGRYATLAGRLPRQDELDAAISAWTLERTPFEAEAILQAGGVPAHAVIRAANAAEDAQLAHRGHVVRVPHSLHGDSWVEGSRFRLSRTPAQHRPAPRRWGTHRADPQGDPRLRRRAHRRARRCRGLRLGPFAPLLPRVYASPMARRRRRRQEIPEEERLQTVRIERIVAGGRGLARLPDGKALMAAFAAPGELVEVEVERIHPDYVEGVVSKVIEPSRTPRRSRSARSSASAAAASCSISITQPSSPPRRALCASSLLASVASRRRL